MIGLLHAWSFIVCHVKLAARWPGLIL